MVKSRPVWGAWIEIFALLYRGRTPVGRAPYGARGLKCIGVNLLCILLLSRPVWGAWIEIRETRLSREKAESRPVWGAWIEIGMFDAVQALIGSRAPYGARGLKFSLSWVASLVLRRAPYGARGLKYQTWSPYRQNETVAPRMGRVD